MFICSIFQKVGLKFLIYYKASEFVRRKKPKIVKLFKENIKSQEKEKAG